MGLEGGGRGSKSGYGLASRYSIEGVLSIETAVKPRCCLVDNTSCCSKLSNAASMGQQLRAEVESDWRWNVSTSDHVIVVLTWDGERA